MEGITKRAMSHNGQNYDAGAKVSFPDEEFALLEELGFVTAAPPETKELKAKA